MSIKLKKELPNLHEESFEELKRNLRVLNPDKAYTIFVSDKRAIRSNRQNRYYWGVIMKAMEDHLGMEAAVCHALCKDKFLKRTIERLDHIYEYVLDSKSLNTKEFTQYIEDVRRWIAQEFDIPTPDPNEMTDEQYIYYMSEYNK